MKLSKLEMYVVMLIFISSCIYLISCDSLYCLYLYIKALNYPKMGDSVQIHYVASLPDGTVFDSSYRRLQPINFVLGRNMVIPGFEEVVPTMSRGQKSKVTMPPDWAYGAEGYPPIVPPNAIIIYEIELLSFSSIGTTNLAELGMELPPRKTMTEMKN